MENFYSQWLIQEQHLLNDLLSVPGDRPDLHIPLITRALSHYAEYYTHKSQLANRDIFRAFSAYWLTASERSFFWLGGLNPGIFFHSLPSDLSPDQSENVEQLRQQMLKRTYELEEQMRCVEEAMAVLIALASVHGKAKNGEARGETTERVAEMMHAVLEEADNLRKNVVRRNLEILSSAQTVRFFAALAHRHLSFYWQGFMNNSSQY
jgi:Seed dormancy control